MPGFELALLRQLLASLAWNFTTQPRKQNTRYSCRFDLWILCHDQTHHPPSRGFINVGKKWRSSCKYFDLDIVTFQNIFSSMADFRDVVSVLLAARLIKASRIFVAVQKANQPWEINESFLAFLLFEFLSGPQLQKVAACELIGAKKGRNFQFNLFP